MKELIHTQVRATGLLLVVCINAGCHLILGDFEAVESENIDGNKQDPDGAAAVCTENDFRCQDASLQSCIQGKWTELSSCARKDYCLAEEGRCKVCLAGEYWCDGQKLQKCNSTEDGWITDTECPVDRFCDEVGKRCTVCRRNTARCSADNRSLETCDDYQSSWRTVNCAPEGCIDEPDDCDYCAGCSDEGKWLCSPCDKLLHCEEGKWIEKQDCRVVGSCVTYSSGGVCTP